MASIQSLKASDGTGNASVATVQSTRIAPATTIVVNTVAGIPTNFHGTMGTPHTFTDPVTSETITVISEATAVDFKGHVDGSNLEIDTIAPGYTDAGSAVGDIVIIRPTTQWADEVVSVLETVMEDDGDIKADAPINSPQATLANVTPVGSVLDFAGTAAPTGWLLAYGQTLNAAANTEYADLYAVIGNTYGGSDNTDFVVPDLRGRVVAGKDDMGGTSADRLTSSETDGVDGDTLGATGGSEDLQSHTHSYLWGQGGNASNGRISGYLAAGSGVTSADSEISIYNSGDGDAGNVQPTIILNKIIKY